MLFIMSLWFIYFVTRGLYLLMPFNHFAPTISLPFDDHTFAVCTDESVFICFLDSTYMWNHTVFVFPVWFISLSLMLYRSTHVVTNGNISFFMAE